MQSLCEKWEPLLNPFHKDGYLPCDLCDEATLDRHVDPREKTGYYVSKNVANLAPIEKDRRTPQHLRIILHS